MRTFTLTALLFLATASLHAQGDGIGGVLIRDVATSSDDDDIPSVLPVGGIVAFGVGYDWSSSYRNEGKVRVSFLAKNEEGDVDREMLMIPEDAVKTFAWACGAPITSSLDPRHPIICTPFISKYANQWQLRFVEGGRRLAQELGIRLVEEFSTSYEGTTTTATGAPTPSPPAATKCSTDQILKMKDAGLSDSQIKAACGG